MTKLEAFERADGTFGIRNHLFLLPAVVCVNQVAIDVASQIEGVKYIEHQHGCAQIGADLAQASRIFSNLAIHPNVAASMFLGLGCEGLVAQDLFSRTKSRSNKPMDLVIIQESGGTLGAEAKVRLWAGEQQASITNATRTTIDWRDLTIGVFSDSNTDAVPEVLTAVWQTGARVVTVQEQEKALHSLDASAPSLAYGETSECRAWSIQPGSTALETATALTAAGAHIVVHLADHPHAFGTPLAPLTRWATSSSLQTSMPDDFDGAWLGNTSVADFIEHLGDVVNGQLTAAEELGMDDFALYRIGPTV